VVGTPQARLLQHADRGDADQGEAALSLSDGSIVKKMALVDLRKRRPSGGSSPSADEVRPLT
jgi:hypothetical protein